MIPLLGTLGVILILGGIAHAGGVLSLYATKGLPDANRILIDVWIGQAQLMAGVLYLVAFRRARRTADWGLPAVFGALTIIGFGAAMLPVLFARAPIRFRIPVLIYVACSVLVLIGVMLRRRE